MEASSDAGQKLSAFISQLLSGVVESVSQQGYQVAFLASKCGSTDILSLHGGLSLSIQKQLEVNFRNLIREAAQDEDCSICQSPEETIQSNHTVSIPMTDDVAALSSHDDLTSDTRKVMESAAPMDTIKVGYTAKFDASLTGDSEYSQTTDNDSDVAEEYNDGETLDDGPKQPLQIKTELPHDMQIESDDTLTRSYPEPEQNSEHLRGKKKKCKYCKYTTKYKSQLMLHMRTHTGEKPFACPQCPYRTTLKTSLRRHIMTHTGEKPFACPECPYRSTNKSHLKRHIQTHRPTGDKALACSECPFRSTNNSQLKRHMLTHRPYGEKPFACPECPYRSIEQRNLKMHMLKHSGEKQ